MTLQFVIFIWRGNLWWILYFSVCSHHGIPSLEEMSSEHWSLEAIFRVCISIAMSWKQRKAIEETLPLDGDLKLTMKMYGFTCCYNKRSDQSKVGKQRIALVQLLFIVQHSGEGMMVRVWGSWAYCIRSEGEERDEYRYLASTSLSLPSFFFFLFSLGLEPQPM